MHRGGHRGNFRGRGGGGRGRGAGGDAWNDGRFRNEGGTAEHPVFSGNQHQPPMLETWGNQVNNGADVSNTQPRRGPPSRDDGSRSRGGSGRGRGDYHGPRGGVDSYQGGPQRSTVIVFVNPERGRPSISHEIDAIMERLKIMAAPISINMSSPRSSATGGISFLVGDIDQAIALKSLSGLEVRPGQRVNITTSEDKNKLAGMQFVSPSFPRNTSSSPGPSLSTVGYSVTNGVDVQAQSRVESDPRLPAIQQFIRSRYNNGFLNLDNMAQDRNLGAARISPLGDARSNSGYTILKAAAELFPDITTISFAHNRLYSVESIQSVAKFFPGLLNLSLKGNNIREYRDVEFLGGQKLPNLRELILTNNPLRDQEISESGDDMSYRSRITRLFPSVQVLDQLPVAPRITFGVSDVVADIRPVRSVLPKPVRANFFDSPSTEATVLEFLTSFFNVFDSNRSLLEHVYDSAATFSYQVADPHHHQYKRHDHHRRYDSWDIYNSKDRNLNRTSDLVQRTAALSVGSRSIVHQGLSRFPSTIHDLSDGSKFCVDAWQTGGLLATVCLYVMVHGEFEEISSNYPAPSSRGRRSGYDRNNGSNSKVRRSFDRAFILIPAPQGTIAADQGWKCLIVSDQMTLRNYSGSEAWKPETGSSNSLPAIEEGSSIPALMGPHHIPTITAAAPSAIELAQQLQNQFSGLSSEQQAKMQELQRITGLKFGYALECMNVVGWDMQQGVALVNEKRATIPADAWQAPFVFM
ncbi:nuclear RNA export factor [Entomortierella parvispora]|uniref:Nuclear RNA export factor n=1 Tax=Entomortierella parvispora TaxID=205924 RepID=A0A9P3HF46_9FUNG|nr:nuclear RNA export factor [Entomortierella parvispora]